MRRIWDSLPRNSSAMEQGEKKMIVVLILGVAQ